MDVAFSYSTPNRVGAMIYLPPGYEPPDKLDVDRDGETVTFLRLSDRSLVCEAVVDVRGNCDSLDCHRRVLGDCQCGRHEKPRFARADQG